MHYLLLIPVILIGIFGLAMTYADWIAQRDIDRSLRKYEKEEDI